MPDTVHILLPVHNRREITRRFVLCLKAQTWRDYHLILIDDGSSDDTAGMVRSEIGPVTVIRGSGDWWWGGSLHQGYLWLTSHGIPESDIVLIANDDTEVGPDFLERGVALLAAHERTLLLAHCYDRRTGELIDAGVEVDWRHFRFRRPATPERVNCLSTRGLFLRVADFHRTGGFHPRLLPHYLSDYEFTIRAGRKGLRLLTDPSLGLRLDTDATGEHQYETGSWEAFRRNFSRRSATNPLATAAFIALACPWPWKPFAMARHCLGTWKTLCRAVMGLNGPDRAARG